MTVGQDPVDDPQGLERHPVDFEDLRFQQLGETVIGQDDPELVDHFPAAPLEDVDRHHVTPHRTDPAGYRPQGTGSVGQPQPNQIGGHLIRVRGGCERPISCR